MRKNRILQVVVTCAPALACGQNLVPNGSFEDYTDCPDNVNQVIGNVDGWTVCGPESPDYFHSCRDTNDFSVPSNRFGYQMPYHGNAYVGVGTFDATAWTFGEFVCTQLTQPLQIGVPVYLDMKVALGGFGSTLNVGPRWTSRGVGMTLTTEPFEWPWPNIVYPNDAHLFLDEVLIDTMSWLSLSTVFVPDSAYEYITIGNFFDDSLSTPMVLDTTSFGWQGAYVFVDAVCVGLNAGDCDFSQGLADQHSAPRVLVPATFSDQLVVERTTQGGGGDYKIGLYSVSGQRLYMSVLTREQQRLTIPTVGLADGVYIVHVHSSLSLAQAVRAVHVSP